MRSKIKPIDPSRNELNLIFVPGLCASESLFSRFSRWVNHYHVNCPDICRLLRIKSLDVPILGPVLNINRAAPMPELPVDFSEHILRGETHPEMRKDRPPLHKLGILMGLSRSDFLEATGSIESEPGIMLLTQIKQLRFCPSCLDLGFHSIYFQYPGATDCPYHSTRLRNTCKFCKQPNFPTIRSIVASPASCWNCGRGWSISNSEIRNDSLLEAIPAIGAMMDSRIRDIKPIPNASVYKFGSLLNFGYSDGLSFPHKEIATQARRWTFWNETMNRCRGMHNRIVPYEESLYDPQARPVPVSAGDRLGGHGSKGFWPVSNETVVRANEVLKWLSHECSFHADTSFRLRSEIGMNPQGRCTNLFVGVVHVALHQTMLTYGRQENNTRFPLECEEGGVDVYADVRWNHLQLSRVSSVESPANSHLIEAEILSWFAVSLVRARGLKFSLEVAWPWYLNPWQFVPPNRTVRIGTTWAVHYRSRASRDTVVRLISRYRNTFLCATHLQDLREALQMAHIVARKSTG